MDDAISSEEDEEFIFSSTSDRSARWDPPAGDSSEFSAREVKRRKPETQKRQGRFSHAFRAGDARAFRLPTDRCLWWSAINHPDVRDERSRAARKFRRKFRLPMVCVEELVRRAQQIPEWCDKAAGAGRGKGPARAPLIIKVLAALRHLGTGACLESLEDACFISTTALRAFVPPFIKWLGTVLFKEQVTLPESEDLDHSLRVFESLGFPGAYCSSDGVHCAWDACPALWHARFKGKEHYPTLAWNVSVLHSRLIIHVADWNAGAVNDMTQARHDNLFQALHSNRFMSRSRS